ncbi:hypothetical protein BU14_0617s0006 [Porphyra umbilicalis]|uniref:Uncharacterized protein n=1 Tax=Porphyra umbilicalis TaxID=2786 RepID=A0A1X6NR38_PORUM|nr:hypothetical protein BU14_0617s0006 [Porphyra umbilicalis]|eukprot:OSX71000.1 hypothetical protein BU14_0617s0006 [Porphyra umbilicalis]
MEATSLAAGAPRIKFTTTHAGATTARGLATPAAWAAAVAPLTCALDALAATGGAPVLPDGAVAGNGALVDAAGGLLVSRSAKAAGVAASPADVVRVVRWDARTWAATYETPPVGVPPPATADGGVPRPSSDTPLLWAALMGPAGPAAAGAGAGAGAAAAAGGGGGGRGVTPTPPPDGGVARARARDGGGGGGGGDPPLPRRDAL